MSLEEDIRKCLPIAHDYYVDITDFDVDAAVQSLVALIRERERLFVEQVGRLKVDAHFAMLKDDEDQEADTQERIALQERIEDLEKQLGDRLDVVNDESDDGTPCICCSKVETFLGNKRCACCNKWYCYDCYDEHQQQVIHSHGITDKSESDMFSEIFPHRISLTSPATLIATIATYGRVYEDTLVTRAAAERLAVQCIGRIIDYENEYDGKKRFRIVEAHLEGDEERGVVMAKAIEVNDEEATR